jgi:predicted GTPase
MKIKPTNAYEHIRIYYIVNVINLLHVQVSATSVTATWRSYKKYLVQRLQKAMHRYKILRFKMYGLKHMLKYKMQLKLFELNLSE